MSSINESEQWLLEGKCHLCRRKDYCSKPCTRNKKATSSILRATVVNAIDDMTGGAYSETMNRIENYY